MALLDPLALLGQSWDVWLDSDTPVPVSDTCSTEAGPSWRHENVVACLPHPKAPCYGRCPSRDALLFVRCRDCSECVKPIAYNHHYNCRHVLKSRVRSSPVPAPDSSVRVSESDDFESVLLSPQEPRASQDTTHDAHIPPSASDSNIFASLRPPSPTAPKPAKISPRAFARARKTVTKRTKLKEQTNHTREPGTSDDNNEYVVKPAASGRLTLKISKHVYDETNDRDGIRIEPQPRNRRKQSFASSSPNDKTELKVLGERSKRLSPRVYDEQEFIALGPQTKTNNEHKDTPSFRKLMEHARKRRQQQQARVGKAKAEPMVPNCSLSSATTSTATVAPSPIPDAQPTVSCPPPTPWDTNNNHPKPIAVSNFGARRIIRGVDPSLTSHYLFTRKLDPIRRQVARALHLRTVSPPPKSVDEIYDELVRESKKFERPSPQDSASPSLRQLLSQERGSACSHNYAKPATPPLKVLSAPKAPKRPPPPRPAPTARTAKKPRLAAPGTQGATVVAVTAQGQTAQIWCDFETGKFYQLNGQNGPGNGATALILPNAKNGGLLVARAGVKPSPPPLLKAPVPQQAPLFVNIAPGPAKGGGPGSSGAGSGLEGGRYAAAQMT